ncbi:MAG: glycoside hydrolase family 65 protein [Candidatus Limnocylindria bacterium]
MQEERVFAIDPWSVRERGLHLDLLGHTESVFALSNGHIGIRGNLDEGEPFGEPGTYLSGFYETRPLPYAEPGYGYPRTAHTLVNATNGKILRLLVDDEPFDVRYGELVRHERVLDLRDGVLVRDVEWRSPAGAVVQVRSTRLVSFAHRSIAAILYEVRPVARTTRIVVQSELVANEPVSEGADDPRSGAALRAPLVGELHTHGDLHASLVHVTKESSLRLAAAMDHVIDGPETTVTHGDSDPDLARVTVTTQLEPGQHLRIVKLIAYGWSSRRSFPAVRDQVEAALASAKRTGWDGLRKAQREHLDTFWRHADVDLDGDPALQQAVRFALFHVLQSAARAEQRAVPAKGLTGRGYDGHSFWDMDAYLLRVLTYTAPAAARDALRWRHATLGLATERARSLGLAGAAFPWRTIRGTENSGYWPAATAAYHINAAIADAVRRYIAATGDREFEERTGVELLVATARLWRSLGHHDATGAFRIDGVTGPDEYSALGDNNVYTNLMAARNLREAADIAARHPAAGAALGVNEEEIASWRDAAAAMTIPFDEKLEVHPQSESFTRYRRWDFASTRAEQYPLLLHFHNYLLYSSQVVKQADLVFALYACGDAFDAAQKARDFAYYERVTVRDSSLSAPIQAIVACEVGYLDLAYDYFEETALVDLLDLAHNTDEGVHLAALSGAWLVAVAGFGGMRDEGETLAFAPRLPPRLRRLVFRLLYRGRLLRVEVGAEGARYELVEGDALEILHHGERIRVASGGSETRPLPPVPALPPIEHPAGRKPPSGHIEAATDERPLPDAPPAD